MDISPALKKKKTPHDLCFVGIYDPSWKEKNIASMLSELWYKWADACKHW